VFATAEGLALASSGLIRDALAGLVARGTLGPGLSIPSFPYSVVYHIEIAALFATLIALGPLVRSDYVPSVQLNTERFGLADLPA
jgi:BCD family chlorophyll transporter-like MFS transporter